jgi:hypothetical protein
VISGRCVGTEQSRTVVWYNNDQTNWTFHMGPHITKAQARAFRERWQAVNDAEREELRRTSPEVKLRQLEALFAMSQQLGWTAALAAEEAEVRERWNRLRKAYGACSGLLSRPE